MCAADYIRAYTSYIRVEKKRNKEGMGAYMVVMGRGWEDIRKIKILLKPTYCGLISI